MNDQLIKKALKLRETPVLTINRALASTAGQLSGLPTALMVAQEDFPSFYTPPDEELLKKKLAPEFNDPHLKDVVLRLNSSDAADNVLRVIKNENLSPSTKAIGVPLSILGSVMSDLQKSPHYDPFANAAVIYGNTPEVARHELGHAKDFNANPEETEWKALQLGIQNLIPSPFNALGPATQRAEYAAHNMAMKLMADDPQARRDYRRRVYTGYGTYLGGLAGAIAGVAMAHRKRKDGRILAAQGAGVGSLAGVGVGRLVAELLNLKDNAPGKDALEDFNPGAWAAVALPTVAGAILGAKMQPNTSSLPRLSTNPTLTWAVGGAGLGASLGAALLSVNQLIKGKKVPFTAEPSVPVSGDKDNGYKQPIGDALRVSIPAVLGGLGGAYLARDKEIDKIISSVLGGTSLGGAVGLGLNQLFKPRRNEEPAPRKELTFA